MKKKTFASIYSGGGGSDLGAMMAGFDVRWGVEIDPAAADCYEVNIGHRPITKSALCVDFSTLEKVDVLGASPPCVRASRAASKAKESLMDAGLAAAVCSAIDAILPEVFVLENVSGYRSFSSYVAIKETLEDNGYKWIETILNSADYGVAQTRKRLFLIASRIGVPQIPIPTHVDPKKKSAQLSLFDAPRGNWIGWYQAIEDLIPDLPDSKLARWQTERLPEHLKRLVLQDESTDDPDASAHLVYGMSTVDVRHSEHPATTVTVEGVYDTRAIIIDGQLNDRGSSITHRDGSDPIFTINAQKMTKQKIDIVVAQDDPSSVMFQSNWSSWERANKPIAEDRPSHTLRANTQYYGGLKIVAPDDESNEESVLVSPLDANRRHRDDPSHAIMAHPHSVPPVAILQTKRQTPSVRVKRLTVRALARLQGLPDSFVLPDKNSEAGRIVGNAVCPPVECAILRAQYPG
jgi:DNA-cytosine methyltransferase